MPQEARKGLLEKFKNLKNSAVKEPLRFACWVLFDNQAPRCGAVSFDFLRKIKRVTVFLTIIT